MWGSEIRFVYSWGKVEKEMTDFQIYCWSFLSLVVVFNIYTYFKYNKK